VAFLTTISTSVREHYLPIGMSVLGPKKTEKGKVFSNDDDFSGLNRLCIICTSQPGYGLQKFILIKQLHKQYTNNIVQSDRGLECQNFYQCIKSEGCSKNGVVKNWFFRGRAGYATTPIFYHIDKKADIIELISL